MEGYLGEFPLSPGMAAQVPKTKAGLALMYIEHYGQIEGDHHRAWVIDQVARILMGTPVLLKAARWKRPQGVHSELRFSTGEPSKKYLAWRAEGEVQGYDYDEGIAP